MLQQLEIKLIVSRFENFLLKLRVLINSWQFNLIIDSISVNQLI